MSKYVIDSETLESLADAVRSVTGITRRLTPEEMIAEVRDILNATTFVLVDKDGNEYPAAYIDSDIVFTATPNDIRKGCTAITADGVVTGEKEIPVCHTSEGRRVVPNGSAFIIPHEHYDYEKLQAIICRFNTSLNDSVAAEKVVIMDHVYAVDSTVAISDVVKDADNIYIDLGITNDTGGPCILRYFMYKEIY